MPDFETILRSVDNAGIATITFNRPDVRNALNQQMVDETRAALTELGASDGVAAVIFTGAGGKAFISGADIAELRDRTRADALLQINSALFREIEQLPMPTIAAVVGYALGGGCELAMTCDLRVAGEGAHFGQPEVGLGIIPGAGATYRMPRLVGIGRARELIFTGRIIDAATALEIGLVNRVAPDDKVVDVSHELATEIAKNSRLAVRMAKSLLNAASAPAGGVEAAMAQEAAAQAVLFEGDEKRARMTAFLERRKNKKP